MQFFLFEIDLHVTNSSNFTRPTSFLETRPLRGKQGINLEETDRPPPPHQTRLKINPLDQSRNELISMKWRFGGSPRGGWNWRKEEIGGEIQTLAATTNCRTCGKLRVA